MGCKVDCVLINLLCALLLSALCLKFEKSDKSFGASGKRRETFFNESFAQEEGRVVGGDLHFFLRALMQVYSGLI